MCGQVEPEEGQAPWAMLQAPAAGRTPVCVCTRMCVCVCTHEVWVQLLYRGSTKQSVLRSPDGVEKPVLDGQFSRLSIVCELILVPEIHPPSKDC